jgi:EmrB/QacA subfamily drug resistance transporter
VPREVPSSAHERRWWTLGVLCLAITVIGVDNTILNVALPSMQRLLDATGSQLQWMVDSYAIVFAGLLLTAGSLGDRYGRRTMLVFGLTWFAVFSMLAARADSAIAVIVARGLMGLGGACIFPTTLSILTNTFRDPRERARAIGVWAGVSGIGIALGPVAGGLLVEHFGWQSVFYVNLPVCAAAVIGALRFVPNSRDPHDSPLDPLGAVLSIVGLGALLYGVIEAPDNGWADPHVLAGLLVGVVFLGLFALWEAYTPRPMLDVTVFKNPRFSAASATMTITYFALFASTFLLTQYFQFILGYSPLRSGLMLTPVAIGLMLAAPRAPHYVERWGTKRVVLLGLALVMFGMACYSSDAIMSSFTIGLVVRFVYGLGMGLMSTPVTESIMGSLPPSRAGVGSAINDTTRQTGGAVGVAVLGSLFLARYHSAIGALGFVPASSRAAARESIGTSLETAGHLSPSAAAQLQSAAHDAYVSSMHLTYAFAVVIIAIAVFVAWRFLPAHAVDEAPVDIDTRVVAIEDAVA